LKLEWGKRRWGEKTFILWEREKSSERGEGGGGKKGGIPTLIQRAESTSPMLVAGEKTAEGEKRKRGKREGRALIHSIKGWAPPKAKEAIQCYEDAKEKGNTRALLIAGGVRREKVSRGNLHGKKGGIYLYLMGVGAGEGEVRILFPPRRKEGGILTFLFCLHNVRKRGGGGEGGNQPLISTKGEGKTFRAPGRSTGNSNLLEEKTEVLQVLEARGRWGKNCFFYPDGKKKRKKSDLIYCFRRNKTWKGEEESGAPTSKYREGKGIVLYFMSQPLKKG